MSNLSTYPFETILMDCPSSQSKKIAENDAYRMYPGQNGHNMKKCSAIDEQNAPHTLCKMMSNSKKTNQLQTTVDNYLTFDDTSTHKIVSCQNMVPSYYPNMTENMIGKMPVYSVRNCEYTIPDIIIKNKDNLSDRVFDCNQPQWCWKCV